MGLDRPQPRKESFAVAAFPSNLLGDRKRLRYELPPYIPRNQMRGFNDGEGRSEVEEGGRVEVAEVLADELGKGRPVLGLPALNRCGLRFL